MRAFVAIEVTDSTVLDALASFQRELALSGGDLKLVERQNLHFTVRFLGEINQGQADETDLRLRGLVARGGRVEVRGVGAFPDTRRPRVVWAGVPEPGGSLVSAVAARVRSVLHGIGEEDGRPFTPHLTLARVRSPQGVGGLTTLLAENSEEVFGSTVIGSVKLKSSRLSGEGPTYSDLGEYPLS